MRIKSDESVDFPAFFVRDRTKTEQRRLVADHGLLWVRLQHARKARGAVMVDIDDTLIDGNECVQNGFEFMHYFYNEAALLYPVHVVTARPDDQHANVMRLLRERGFCVPPDRLHMLPSHLYGRDTRHVEDFKWKAFLEIGRTHGGVIARFGDKLWDVAHVSSLESYLTHVDDRDCYLFLDPALKGTFSGKLPGA